MFISPWTVIFIMFFVIFDIRHYVMKTKIILRDVTGQWILVLTTWCALVFGDLWPNLPGSSYTELRAWFPFWSAQNAKRTDSENLKQGFALDVTFQNVTVCYVRKFFSEAWNPIIIFRELWKGRFIFRETWSIPHLYYPLSYWWSAVPFCE